LIFDLIVTTQFVVILVFAVLLVIEHLDL